MSSILAGERPADKQLDASMLPGLTPKELEVLKKVFSSPLDIPAEWRAWLVSYLEANPPQIPIGMVSGFSAFTADYATQPLSGSITVANAWQTLSNPGPALNNLPSGKYVLLYGASYSTPVTSNGYMGYCINGAALPAENVAIGPSAGAYPISKATVVSLPLDTAPNTITFKYQSNATGGPSFSDRWALALKYANL